MEESTKKAPMTDEERLALAAKLDKELDEFIEKLPKRKPREGPLEDGWLEEFDKHPFFMKKAPEPGEELHPLYHGLQQLKYDPDENTPEELATSYKEDGNFNFKHKNYRLAILAYTEGIKVKCDNVDIEASLYNNRSAANWFLKNYRSCVRDCELALKLKPDYEKTLIRAANASFALEKYDVAIDFCDRVLSKIADHKEMLELRKRCINTTKAKQRDARKKETEQKKRKKEEEMIIAEIQKRGITIEQRKDALKLETFEPHFPELANHRVFLNQDRKLVWPVVFMYPEYQIMDFVQQFCESDTFAEQIEIVFAEGSQWDKNGTYKPNNLNVYYENGPKTRVYKVNTTGTLLDVLKNKNFMLRGGTPSFILFVKESPPERNFLEKYAAMS